MSKAPANLDEWLKDVAPSPDLRKWWDHGPDRIDEFAERYRDELEPSDKAADALTVLRRLAAKPAGVTLLYGAKDPAVNHAKILRDYLIGLSDA
jgi:uncharacterized protein YeaO (DUF488 family)